jgi:hypothetical protein
MTDRRIAVVLASAMFVIYNANGREIPSYDTQPAKYAARELLLRGTLSLNHVVGRTPELGQRSAFVLARDGRYRSAYSPVGSIMAAALLWPFWKTGLLDIRAPGAPSLIAATASSFLVAIAVALAYLIARRDTSRGRAIFIAVAFGLGTGLWCTASRSLWQHESAILGLTLAVFGLGSKDGSWTRALIVGLGLGLAGAARLQLAPAVLLMLVGTGLIRGWRDAAIATACTAAVVTPILIENVRWFGSVLGAAPMLEALHESIHGKVDSFSLQWEGVAGLLWSPSRGLLVFSPVVALSAVGLRQLPSGGWRSPLAVCVAAAALQFILYASYSVWWAGHTYGPRYVLDILPLLLPLAAAAAGAFIRPLGYSVAGLTLAWSIFVSGLGAFCYPHDGWNSSPADVDRAHERLWDWSDNQIARAWKAGASPQNFDLASRGTFRVPNP